jgi:hypothetical protein
MAITAQKLLPQKTGGAMVPIKKSAITKITPIGVKKSISADPAEGEEKDTLVVIKERCIEIDTLLKGSLALDKIRADQSRKKSEKKERAEGEKELEKSDNKDEKKGKDPKLPKISFFDRIKNFIKNVILGFIVTRLIKFAPQIAKVLSFLAPIGKFIFAVGEKLLEGFVNLVDFGYKIYDSGRKFIGDKLGDEALANFDKLSGAINTMLNLALIAAMATGAGLGRGKKPKVKSKVKPKVKTKVDPKLKKMGLSDDQIKAYNKARQGGAGATDALTQARKVKPKPKPKGFFGRIGQGFSDFGTATKDLATKGVKALGGGLNFLSGGNLGKFGNFLQDQYKNASKFARNSYDKVAQVASNLKNKAYQGIDNFKKGAANLADNVKKAAIQKVIEPLKPIFDPILNRVKKVGESIMGILRKIPGFELVDKVLRKNGVKGIGDAKGLLKKVGGKAIPIVGGIVNLLFAYDRLAQGDLIGGLLEGASGVLDLSGAFGFVPGPGISMGIDAYMFARDFIPQIQETEGKIVDGIGLGGLKGQLEAVSKKLPDLSTIAKMFTGGDPNKPMIGDKGETSGTTKSNLGSTPTTASGNSDVKVGGSNVVAIGKDLTNKGFTVAEHPDFTKDTSGGAYTPGEGSVSNVHKGRGHYESRAIDVTNFKGGDPGYKQSYLPVLNSLENNSAIKMLIHDTWGFYKDGGKSGPGSYGHPEHMHIEVKDEGGFIGKGLFKNKGGVEFVLDHDTTKALEQTLPGFLNAINKADGKSVMDVLGKYASYDMPEIIPVPVPQPIQNAASDAYGKAKSAVTNVIVKGKEAFSDILYMR